MLVVISHMLDHARTSQELGGNSLEKRDRRAVEKRLVRSLEKEGYQVSLEPATQVA